MWDFPPGIHKDSVKTFRNLLSIMYVFPAIILQKGVLKSLPHSPMKKIVAEKQPGQSRASCFVNKDV